MGGGGAVRPGEGLLEGRPGAAAATLGTERAVEEAAGATTLALAEADGRARLLATAEPPAGAEVTAEKTLDRLP